MEQTPRPTPRPSGLKAILLSREGLSALFCLVCALIVGLEASGLSMGRGRMIGPGYFPALLSALLVIFAIILLVQARKPGRAVAVAGPMRPPVMMVLAIAAFGLLFPVVGGAGAIAALVVLAALAESGRSLLEIAVMCVIMVALVWLVFRLGLNLQLPMLPRGF